MAGKNGPLPADAKFSEKVVAGQFTLYYKVAAK
jgi:hypothetical protein